MQRTLRRLTALVAAALVMTSALTATNAQAALDVDWIPWSGPTGADSESWVRAFANSGSTVYAGTEGSGAFRSIDSGVTWSRFSTNLAAGSNSVRDIEINSPDVFIGTTGGLFKSNAGGAWQPVGQGAGANKLNEAVQTIHRDGSTMLVGVVGGIFRSTDGGNTWSASDSGLPEGVTVWSLDSYPFVPSRIFAATSGGAYLSQNGGSTWAPVTAGLPTGTNILRVMPDQVNPSRWYAITSGAGIYRSSTAGLSWEPVNNGLGSNLQVRSIAQIPVGASYRVVIGTQDGVFTTYDSGDSWSRVSNSGLNDHTITWALAMMPNNPASTLIGTQGGGVHYRIMQPPLNTVAPALSDTTPVVGQQITTTTGTWTGTPDIQYSYEWERCSGFPQVCSTIDGATSATYTVALADQGQKLRSIVRTANPASPPGYGSTPAGNEPSALSSAVGAAPGSLPGANTSPNPTITNGFGTISVGNSLTAAVGVWSPAATATAYEWFRCDSNGDNCESAGSGNPYVLKAADADHRMRVRVRQTNGSGSVYSELSAYSSQILPLQVAQTSPAAVLGKPWVGQVLSRSIGSYNGPFANNYTTWQVCETAAGTGCTTLDASNKPTVTLNSLQKGKYLRVKVEVDVNGFNQVPATLVTYSPTLGPVVDAPAKVTNTAAPTISGRAVRTLKMTLSRGTWTGAPTFTQQWLRCSSTGTNCAPISGATGLTYILTSADVGKRVRARVTGVNAWGDPVSAQTAVSAVVANNLKPVYAGGGSISGTALVGRTLTAKRGTWIAVPAATFTYQWTRSGTAIAGATGATYVTRSADKGRLVGVKVTAKNLLGSTTVALPARKIG